jgi:hypothetical protein
MSSDDDPDDDLYGVGSRARENSLGGSDVEVEEEAQSRHGASSNLQARARGGADGIIPRNSMAIVPTHPNMNVDLFDTIVVCEPESMSEEETAMTNDDILQLSREAIRLLARKCKYKYVNRSGRLSKKGVSVSGTLHEVSGRLLAYYQVLRQQNRLGTATERALSLNPSSWTPAEDARLIEILIDPAYQRVVELIFVPANRRVLDVSDGSPLVSVWKNVVCVLFNNFSRYQPEHPFNDENELILQQCDPNSNDIPRRIPDHLRSRFASLRSRFTRVYSDGWLASGENDPNKFTDFINLTSPLDVSMMYMFRRLHGTGHERFLHRCSRAFNPNFAVDSGERRHHVPTMEEALAHINGNNEQNGSGGTNNNNNDNNSGTTPGSNPRRTPLLELQKDLSTALGMMKQDEEQERLTLLIHNRDHAAEQMDKYENKLDDLDDNASPRKRQRLRTTYKRHKREWLLFAGEAAKMMRISFNEDDYKSSDDE